MKRSAARTAMLMALLTLGVKCLGFAREMVLAAFFGTSYVTDAYVMGTNIPGTLFAGVFTSVGVAFLPLFSSIVEKEGEEAGRRFTNETVQLVGIITVFFSLLCIVFARPIIGFFASGFEGETAALAAFYLRVAASYVLFYGATSVLESFLQYKGIFLPQTAAGYLQSGCVVLAVVISAFTSHYYMAYGLLIGSALRALVVWRVAAGKGLRLQPTLRVGGAAKKIILLALPVFIGSTVNQINTFVDKWLASGLPEGSVSALNYSNLIVTTITALTVTVVTTIIYPRLTQAAAAEDYGTYNDAAAKGMNIILIIGAPFTLGCMLYAAPAIRLIYERGAFNTASTELTAGAFFFYSIGICAIALNALLCKVYYSWQDTRTPVFCGIVGACLNIGLNLLLIGALAHRGLALASSLAALCNCSLLILLLRRKHPALRLVRSGAEVLKIALAALLAVGLSWPLYLLLRAHAVAALLAAVVLAGLLYLLLLKLFRIEELKMLRRL